MAAADVSRSSSEASPDARSVSSSSDPARAATAVSSSANWRVNSSSLEVADVISARYDSRARPERCSCRALTSDLRPS